MIVMLTWLWLSSLALLLGAELNAETERSRELRAGEPAEKRIVAPTKAYSHPDDPHNPANRGMRTAGR